MKIHIIPSNQIGAIVADQVERVIAAKPNAVIAWTTGNTPLKTGIYRELIQRENQGKLDFQSCVFVNPDEQLGIPREHKESYYTYMKNNFFDHIRHAEEQRFIPDGAAADPLEECSVMEQFIRQHGGIDYQLLGLGINGHICFIEPAQSLPYQCFITEIADINRKLYTPLFGSIEAVPTHAVTFGVGTLMKSRKLCLVSVGKEKAEIVARALLGPVTTEVPASLLQLHAKVDVLLDEAAAESFLKVYSDSPASGIRIEVIQ